MNSELLKMHNERFHTKTGYKFMCVEYFGTLDDLLSHEPEHSDLFLQNIFPILKSIFQFNRINGWILIKDWVLSQRNISLLSFNWIVLI